MDRACPLCHTPVRPEARFCPRCGARLEARLAPGTLLKDGDYYIERALTRGGMGDVYLARDQRAFGRLCIIKQMLDYFDVADPEQRALAHQRFEEEGRTLATLRHPGVPEIYTFFEDHGRHYIVMERAEGATLEEFVTHDDENGRLIPRRLLPMEDALRYTIQACRILEYLHSRPRPVVHGDVKPANLIVEQQLGYVRLVDFGTATVVHDGDGDRVPGGEEATYGTEGYAAPEQYRGRPEPRSDVFGLAATAYHLLTDDDPRKHPFQWPRMDRLPRELSLVLQRALRPEAAKRSTASELRQALEAIATPKRALEAFTFPGGAQIRSVAALPSLADEHWDAARSFLYHGDFQRWLRDINRLDLVVAADEIIGAHSNQDAGLEAFLRTVDPGLPTPKIASDPERVELGAVAREAGLVRKVTLLNTSRGYALATLSASEPWLEVNPPRAHLWAGVPVTVDVHVHAEDLPFRSEQRGTVTVQPDGLDPLAIPVSARVSLFRESWRIVRRTLAGAIPGAWRTTVAWTGAVNRATRYVSRPFARHEWLLWLTWLLVSAGLGYLFFEVPGTVEVLLGWLGTGLPPDPVAAISVRVLLALLIPPTVIVAAWLVVVVAAVAVGLVVGFLRGAWKSFFR